MDPITVMTRGGKWYGKSDHTSNKGGLSNCKHDVGKSYDYLSELTELGLWPITPSKWNLDKVTKSLAAFQGRKTAQDGMQTSSIYGGKCSACHCNTFLRMQTLRELVQEKSKGMCLDCVCAGVAQGNGKGCRGEH